jgi:hypothetical protein
MLNRSVGLLLGSISFLMAACGSGMGTGTAAGGSSRTGGTAVASGGTSSSTGGTTAATGSTSATVSQYTWMKQYGPPVGSSPWEERVIANADGTLTYDLMASTPISRSAVLTSSDLVEFDQFLQDSVLTTTLSDPTPCSTTTYWDASESVWLKFADGRPDVSKNIMDCTSAAYSGIRSWNSRLAGYFR